MSKLILCPNCDKILIEEELKNNICPQCGFQFDDKKKMKEISKIYICPICGNGLSKTNAEKDCFICKYCNHQLIKIDMDMSEYMELCEYDKFNKMENTKTLAKKYGGDQFSEEAYEDRIRAVKRENSAHQSTKTTQPTKNVPKCPTCGSTNIRKIGTGERTMSILGLGLFSRKINKTWKCNNCGHTW